MAEDRERFDELLERLHIHAAGGHDGDDDGRRRWQRRNALGIRF